jgi:predicted extracellular nuclease
MCEIENAKVVRDVMHGSVKINNYGLLHYESADARGIDVALIYDSSTMTLSESGYIRFTLPGEEGKATRDILWGKFQYKKESIFVMVNHWPSRSGGQEASEQNRLLAAQNARVFIDSLLKDNVHSKIIFMGDLNDYPSDKAPKLVAEKLHPQITSTSGDFGGSYNYKNEWDVLDHIMVSEGMIHPGCFKKNSIKLVPDSGKIHSFDFLLEEYKGQVVPFRTYGGSKYLGGYSDHLPVSIVVSLP